MTLQQQTRQEIADSLQRVREEIHAGFAETAKPYRISDLIPKSWDSSHEKGQFRNFMAELHVWMQARSDQGGPFNTGCRLHRGRLQNTRNRCVPDLAQDDNKFNKCRVQRGFEAWHMIVRRYDQRNTPDRSSACAALISNISERDRAKDVEQFDDTLRNFINKTNKYEGRFGKIRNGDKTLAVKRLRPESLLNCRFRGTALAYEELLIALENSISDKVTTHSVSKVKKIDTSEPMEIGMALQMALGGSDDT